MRGRSSTCPRARGIRPARAGSLDAEKLRQLGEKLPRGREIRGCGRRLRNATYLLGIRPCETRDHGRVRCEPDDVAGRKWAVELGHGEVLVDDPAALEEDHPHELLALDAEQQGHGPILSESSRASRRSISGLRSQTSS